MKLFKYRDFINESKEDIDSICQKYNIRNYKINEDGSIDVQGNVDIFYRELSKLPLKFRNVTGSFNCGCNKLTSLEGSPQSVGGNFVCNSNQLTSLEGCPQILGKYFVGNNNQITNFKGFPEYYECGVSFNGNPVQEILDLFQSHPKSIYWINEHDVIQEDIIIYDRLEVALSEIGLKPINLKYYKIK